MKLAILITLTLCAYLSASGCRRYLPKGSLRTRLVPSLYVLAWGMALMSLAVVPRFGRLCAEVLAISSTVMGAAFLMGWLLPGKKLKGWSLHLCRGAVVAAIAGPLVAMRFDQVYSLPHRLRLLASTTLGEVGQFVLLGLPGILTVGLAVSLLSLVLYRRKQYGIWAKPGLAVAMGLVCWLLLFANWYAAGLFDIYNAAQHGDLRTLSYVRLSRPGVLRAREYDGSTVMHYVRDPGTVMHLIAIGADVEARIRHGGDSGRTVLHLAANAGNSEVVRSLIQSGAEIDPRDPAHWTPLGRALHENQIHTARILIDSGAALEVVDRAGNSPMHWAAVQDNQKAITLLADAGAAVNHLNGRGKTPLDVAELKSAETKALLKKCGGVTSEELTRPGEGETPTTGK